MTLEETIGSAVRNAVREAMRSGAKVRRM